MSGANVGTPPPFADAKTEMLARPPFDVLGALMRRRPPAVPTIEPSQNVVWMWSRLEFDHVEPPSSENDRA